MVFVYAITPSAFSPARPISVLEMQVPDTKVTSRCQLALVASSRAFGHASRVLPLKNTSASPLARLVTWAATSLAPVVYVATSATVMSLPSIACLKPSS